MGGSGAVYFTARDLDTLRAESARRLEQSRVDAEVNAFLQEELAAVNDRDTDRINDFLGQIEDALGDRIDAFDRLLFGGSVAKHTYVDGLSDIDSLVVLRDESLADGNSSDVRADFRDALLRQLPRGGVEDIRAGTMAVTIEYRDGTEIQLLPAVQSRGEILISSEDGNSWSRIEPRRFAQALTESNKNQGGAVVPAIKLAKAILANTFGDEAPSGYHVEALAIAAFEGYTGARSPKAMLTRLIESAGRDVLNPIRDETGQSRYVDGYLGERGSPARRSLSGSLARLARDMSSQPMREWRALFE